MWWFENIFLPIAVYLHYFLQFNEAFFYFIIVKRNYHLKCSVFKTLQQYFRGDPNKFEKEIT